MGNSFEQGEDSRSPDAEKRELAGCYMNAQLMAALVMGGWWREGEDLTKLVTQHHDGVLLWIREYGALAGQLKDESEDFQEILASGDIEEAARFLVKKLRGES